MADPGAVRHTTRAAAPPPALPLSGTPTLAAFPGLGVSPGLIDTLAAEVNERRTEATKGPARRR